MLKVTYRSSLVQAQDLTFETDQSGTSSSPVQDWYFISPLPRLTHEFFGSLESSIFLLSSISGLPETTTVLPIINTNHSTHIAAKLPCAPHVIVGQNQISHPSPAEAHNRTTTADEEDGAVLPGSLPSLSRVRNIMFSKSEGDLLPGKIERVYYINPYGNEVHPVANPRVLSALKSAEVLIYSIGSLFTRYCSLPPCVFPLTLAVSFRA